MKDIMFNLKTANFILFDKTILNSIHSGIETAKVSGSGSTTTINFARYPELQFQFLDIRPSNLFTVNESQIYDVVRTQLERIINIDHYRKLCTATKYGKMMNPIGYPLSYTEMLRYFDVDWTEHACTYVYEITRVYIGVSSDNQYTVSFDFKISRHDDTDDDVSSIILNNFTNIGFDVENISISNLYNLNTLKIWNGK